MYDSQSHCSAATRGGRHRCGWLGLPLGVLCAAACALPGAGRGVGGRGEAGDATVAVRVGGTRVIEAPPADPILACRAELERAGVPFTSASLLRRVEGGSVAEVGTLLRCGLSPNSLDPRAETRGAPALLRAVESGRLEMVQLLLDRGAIVDLRDRGGEGREASERTALLAAASSALPTAGAIAALLLDRGADPRARDAAGRSVLQLAAQKGPAELLPRLAQAVGAAALAAERPALEERLRVAASRGQAERVRWLLDAGISPDAADTSGIRPLMRATGAERSEIVTLLLDRGARVNAADGQGQTALFFAARRDPAPAAALVALLLERGADPRVVTTDGRTPLVSAIQRGAAGAVALLARGVDPRGAEAAQALVKAAEVGDPEVVSALLSAGVPAALTSRAPGQQGGRSPLRTAAGHEHLEVLRLLLRSGAAGGPQGAYALQEALAACRISTAEALLLGGVDAYAAVPDHDWPDNPLGRVAAVTLLGSCPALVPALRRGDAPSRLALHDALGRALCEHARSGSPRIVAALLNEGADANTRCAAAAGRTVLMHAAAGVNEVAAVVRELLARGADPQVRVAGKTALDLAQAALLRSQTRSQVLWPQVGRSTRKEAKREREASASAADREVSEYQSIITLLQNSKQAPRRAAAARAPSAPQGTPAQRAPGKAR